MRFPSVTTSSRPRRAPRTSLRTAAGLVAVLFAAAGVAPRTAHAADSETLKGKRVIVVSTVTVHDAAVRALEILDQAVAVYEEHLPYRLAEGEMLVFHLYETSDAYRKSLEAAGASALAQSIAATHPDRRETHLLLAPRAEKPYLTLVGGLPEATRFFLCHEGARQYLLRTARDLVEFWPDWYGQGVASWLAERCVRAQAAKDAPASVFLDDRASLVKDALDAGTLPRLDRTLHATQAQSGNPRFLYAAWNDFMGQLAADPKRFAAFHQKVRDLGAPAMPGPAERADRRMVRHAQAVVDALTAVYGPLEALDEARRARIAALRPEWCEVLRFTDRTADGLVVAGYHQSNAVALRVEPAPKTRFTVNAEVQLVGLSLASDGEVHFYVAHEGRRDTGAQRFLDVVLRSDGVASVNAFSDERWQPQHTVREPVAAGLFPPGKRVPVRLTVDAKSILVEVGAKRVLDVSVPPGFDTLGTQIGLGAYDDVVVFRSVTVAAAPK